jgi:uncharacterized Fe-S radical SAM superfamily protein PflX
MLLNCTGKTLQCRQLHANKELKNKTFCERSCIQIIRIETKKDICLITILLSAVTTYYKNGSISGK